MAAATVTPSPSPKMFSAPKGDSFPVPFGYKMVEPGKYQPIVHMDDYLKLVRSSFGSTVVASPTEYPSIGGYHDGLFFQSIPVPSDLQKDIGMIIGKEGFYFKKITEASGVMLIWYNKREQTVEVFGGQTRYHHDGNDGMGAFEFCDDIVGGDEHEVFMDYFMDGRFLMEDAMWRIYDRFEVVREQLLKREIEKVTGERLPKEFNVLEWGYVQMMFQQSLKAETETETEASASTTDP
jgi:hypothetical protein